MEFSILGPATVSKGDREYPVGAAKVWIVLASLAMIPGTPVAIETLVDRLWGEDPPAKAREDLRVYVSRLGRSLRRAVGDEARIVAQAHGYTLLVDPQSIDLHRFRLLRRQADAMAQSGDDEQAITLLRAAEALWRGQALLGLPGAWAARARYSLDEERRAAIAQRVGLELRQGRHGEMVGELHRLTDEYPLDEALVGHLMTALYRSGRQADALNIFQETRARLVDLGIEPNPALVALQQSILNHAPELTLTPDFHPGQKRQPDTLPPDIDGFVGRADELSRISEMSEHGNGSLVNLIEGMPGVGKTALSIRVAHRLSGAYPNAQLFLKFHTHDPTHTPVRLIDGVYQLLRMLDVPTTRIPAGVRERIELWQAEVARRRMILVLDDIRDLEEIRPLLPRTGNSLTIVTSRRRHGQRGGIPFMTLHPLSVDDAITLFTLVGGGQARDTDQVTHAVKLCSYLPLTIRMTASRLRHGKLSGLKELLDELSGHHEEANFTGPLGRDIMPVFDASYQGLTSSQQRLLRYLGISPCADTSIHAAMALTGKKQPATQAAIRALVDHHLLAESSPGHFQLHDVVHTYAATRSAGDDPESERRTAIGSLLSYYLHTVRKAAKIAGMRKDQDSSPADRGGHAAPVIDTAESARTWLESEWRNVLLIARYAAGHEWKCQCADLTDALAGFLVVSGHYDAAIEAHTLALQACRDLDDSLRAARAVYELGVANLRAGHQEAALNHAHEAAALFRALDDRLGEAMALDRIGLVHRLSARFRDALAHHQESTEIYQVIGNLGGLARALCHTGSAYCSLGRYREGTKYLNRALSLSRHIGDKRCAAMTLNNIGAVHQDRGYHRDAMNNYQESLRISKEIDAQIDVTISDHNIARLRQYKGDCESALATYRQVLSIYRSIGDLRYQAYAFCDIGLAYEDKGYHDEALVHHEKAASIAQEIGDRYICVKAWCGIAETYRSSGRHQSALDLYRQALKLAREIEAPLLEAKALQGIGDTLLPLQDPESARIYWRQALDLYQQMGVLEAITMKIRLDTLGESA